MFNSTAVGSLALGEEITQSMCNSAAEVALSREDRNYTVNV